MKRKSMFTFLVLWAGQLISALGTGMTGFALGVYVFTETSRAGSVALLVSALFIPSILLRPAGGLLADRMELGAAEVGDLIVVLQSGAYGYSASPHLFLSHPAPVEVLV